MTRVRAPAIGIGIALAAVLAACSNPPYPRGSLESLFPQPPRPQLVTVEAGGRRLQVAVAPGHANGTPLIFVHGSPGDWKAWARYLDAPALERFGTRYAFDRPGFGGSGGGRVEPDLRRQAELLTQAMQALGLQKPAVLVGHSLGGPLIAWMTLDQPEKVCAAVMVAGSVSSQRESPRWYNRLADTAVARWLLPEELLWSNREMLALQNQLTRLEAQWPRLMRPLVAVQGQRDELVDPRTVDDLAARVPSAWLQVRRVPDQGHFLLWEKPALVVEAIERVRCS